MRMSIFGLSLAAAMSETAMPVLDYADFVRSRQMSRKKLSGHKTKTPAHPLKKKARKAQRRARAVSRKTE